MRYTILVFVLISVLSIVDGYSLDTLNGLVNTRRNVSESMASMRVSLRVREGDPVGVEVLESKAELGRVRISGDDDEGNGRGDDVVRRCGKGGECVESYWCGWECEPVLMAVVARCKVEKEIVRRIDEGNGVEPWGLKRCWKREKVVTWKRCSKARKFEKCVPLVCFAKVRQGVIGNVCEGKPSAMKRVWDESRIVRYKKPLPKYDFLIAKKEQPSR